MPRTLRHNRWLAQLSAESSDVDILRWARRVYREFEQLPDVCTVSDLQRFLGMSRSTIYRFIHRGVFPSFWCGGWRIPKTALWNHRAPGQARWDIWPQICEAQIKTERVQ